MNRSPGAAASPVPILILARGGDLDGAARQLLYLLTHLDRGRFEPVVVVDAPGSAVDAIANADTRVEIRKMRPWRSLRGLPYRWFDARAIASFARSFGARLVHCSDPWRGSYAHAVARGLDVPLVMHVRGPMSSRNLTKHHCLHADEILGIAERYRAEIHSAGFAPERTSIVDDAVDPLLYRPDIEHRQRIRAELQLGEAPVVALVGRIEPLKRAMEFVRSAALVPKEIDATFLLVGSMRKSEYVDSIRQVIAAAGMTDRIRLIARRDDMPAVLGAIDLMATMSGGSVMFEAMACGTCVLSVRPDGRHSQHTEHARTAWCVTADDDQSAADAMTLLLRDGSLRNRLAQAGQSCVIERLSPAVMAQKTMAIYDRALAEHRVDASPSILPARTS